MKKGDEMSGLGIAASVSSVASDLSEGYSYGLGSEKKGWFKMKKLMFAAALCAAGAATAVESQVVG